MGTNEKTSKELDISKPHGSIRGRLEGYPRARFSQEGRIYDGRGVLLYDPEEAVKVEEVPDEPKVEVVPEVPPAPPAKQEKKAKTDKAPNLPGLPGKD